MDFDGAGSPLIMGGSRSTSLLGRLRRYILGRILRRIRYGHLRCCGWLDSLDRRQRLLHVRRHHCLLLDLRGRELLLHTLVHHHLVRWRHPVVNWSLF